jgi:hypothetical protein
MQLQHCVPTSSSSFGTGTIESSGTLSAVLVGTQDASPSSRYTLQSPLSYMSPDPLQSAHSAHTQYSGFSDSLLSQLYYPFAVNTPTLPSTFSFIHSFGSALGS